VLSHRLFPVKLKPIRNIKIKPGKGEKTREEF